MIKNTYPISGVDKNGKICIREITEIWLEPGDKDYVDLKEIRKHASSTN